MVLRQAEELASRYPNTIPIMLDVSSQEGHLDSLLQDHDLVIRWVCFRLLLPGGKGVTCPD